MDDILENVEIETKSYMVLPFLEVKVDDGRPGYFEGYASTFGNVDYGGDVCEKGCFDQTLADHAKADTMPGLYFGHDPREVIGDWLDMKVNAKGLPMAGQLWVGKVARADQEYLRLKSKGPKGLSIGYRTKKYAIDSDRKVRRLQQVELIETSIVPFGMNPKALITDVKSCLLVDGNRVSKRQAEHILREVGGFTQAQAKAAIAKAWDGLLEGDSSRDAEQNRKADPEVIEMLARNIALLTK